MFSYGQVLENADNIPSKIINLTSGINVQVLVSVEGYKIRNKHRGFQFFTNQQIEKKKKKKNPINTEGGKLSTKKYPSLYVYSGR